MIDLQEIRETINQIKRNGSTVGQAEKLALLYIAKDHMEREEDEKRNREDVARGYSRAEAPMHDIARIEPKSEFLKACNGAVIEDVLEVLDRHMEEIAILYPKEYEKIIKTIKNKKSGRA